VSYEGKALQQPPPASPAEPWDTARYVAPDPAWPAEKQLQWYQAATRVLAMNCDERTRAAAARAADAELGKSRSSWPALSLGDSIRNVAPGSSWDQDEQLRWHKVATHVLLLNCDEVTRTLAARIAGSELDGSQ
jgi:hypothetical protein